ncbi:MAG: AMP-binding protein [Campylobacteraceae bacterium]|jgi:acyl-coenzyme A synthetase/AMP-(fatty) acid ligase|nr:AMP-binding protein [Campylobacteraceae bacterium]
MRLILDNEDLTQKIYEVTEQNCSIKELENASGLIDCDNKFDSAVRIIQALHSNARAILYDTSHKALDIKLKEEMRLPVLKNGSKEEKFCSIDYDIMLFTSGTTGMPTGAFKTKKHIQSEVEVLANLFKSYGITKIAASIPFIHIYGILILMLAKFLDIDLRFRERFLPADLADLAGENSLIATTPLYINAFLQTEEKYDFKGSLFVSSTAPLSDTSAGEFCKRFNANIIQLYGSTETGGIAYRKNGESLWQPLHGVVCTKAKDTCLHVHSPWVSDYLYEGGFKHLGGKIKTFDKVEFQGDKFELKGRESNIIKIGGKRLSVIQIESIIENHPKVKTALIDVVKNSDNKSLKDENLLVYIEGEKPTVSELKNLIKKDIGTINIPMEIVMVEKIPKSQMGKKIRIFKNLKLI